MRISTILRVIEDTTITAASAVARRTKQAAHATSVEYNARMLARAQAKVAQSQREWRNMSAAQRQAAARDEAVIQARAAQLIAERNEPRYAHMRSDAEPSVVRDARKTAAKKPAAKKSAPRAKR